MPKFISLLFLILLCTCGRAQKSEALPSRSGSMLVEINTHTLIITVSSADYYRIHRYVSENRYRERPDRFDNYEVVPFAGPGDLRMMHAVIDELAQRGWQLMDSNYELDIENSNTNSLELFTYTEERLHFNFLIPLKSAPAGLHASTVKMAARVAGKDKQTMRGNLLANADSTYTLLVEERLGDRWLELYRLTDAGFAGKEEAPLIEDILLVREYFELKMKTPDGDYRYRFNREENNEYFFSALFFQSAEECGVVEYSVDLGQSQDTQIKARHRESPCDPTRKAKLFFTDVRLNKTRLRNFTPGVQRIELEKIGSFVYL